MNKHYSTLLNALLLCLIWLLGSNHASANSPSSEAPCSGNIVLDSQADVDAWGDCDHLDGVLTIAGSDIHDLTPLSNLTYVSVLVIRNNPMLESLNGLQNLTGLLNSGIEFTIKYNPLLTNIEALGNITVSSLGKVEITHNGNLVSLKGLEGFKSADWLEIKYNHKLQNLEGLEGLNHTGTLFIISNNDGLTSLDGLSSYGYCYNFIVTDNPNLESLQGLQNLQKVSGDLKIENLPKLTNLAGLENLNQVLRLYIRGNSSLADCCGIYPYLGKVSPYSSASFNLYINNNLPGCNSRLDVATSCIKCDEDIFLYSQTEVDSFPGCENVDGDITIIGASIKDLSALSSLKTVSGTLTITSCLNLQTLDGLENLEDVGDLKIYYNQDLEACCSLVKLLETDTNLQSLISNNSPTCGGAVYLLNNCPPLVEFVDLEISLSDPPSTPIYTSYSMELMVTNTGNQTATGVEIKFAKPTTGVTYLGGNEYVATQGTFNPYNGEVWYVGDVLPNDTQTIEVNYYLLQDNIPISYAQVIALNEDDTDSTPNNGTPPSVNEDDEASTAPPTNGPIICTGNMILGSQAEVDAFSGCAIIEGDLVISGQDITNLTPLSSLQEVTGALVIQVNPNLQILTGLEGLTSANILVISNNLLLTDLNPLANFSNPNPESVILENNPDLTSIANLSAITVVQNNLKINFNGQLANLQGLQNLTSVGNQFELRNNPMLTNVDELANFNSTTDFFLVGNTDLEDLGGLQQFTGATGQLVIANNDSLLHLDGLENLQSANQLFIQYNPVLENIDALENLNSCNELYIQDNPSLAICCGVLPLLQNNPPATVQISGNSSGCNSEQDIESSCGPVICAGGVILESQAEVDAFQGCEIIEGQLTIRSPFGTNGASSDITDLTPLLSITKVTGVIVIQNNDSLINLTGLDNITSSNGIVVQSCENINSIQALSGISGEVNVIKISENPSLTNIDGLEGITKTHNTAEIDNNSTLQNLNGLSGLVEVNDVHLYINTNPLLTDIQGLGNLTHINTDLIIGNCDGLENLNGLHNLVYAKSFILADNDALTDVSAVTSLTDVDITFFVANNPLLSDCCIFTDLLNNNNIVSITIENNAPGCNSEQDIESSCGPVICIGDLIFESQAEMDAFQGCEIIEGNLIIRSPFGVNGASSDITDLSPLYSLTEVTESLILENNDQLFNLTGLENITKTGTLVIRDCDNLSNIQALSGLAGEIGGSIIFWDNPALPNLNGLNGITESNGTISLIRNSALQNLDGLSNLGYVNLDLEISENVALTNIQGLSQLDSVGSQLLIANCTVLQNLNGLNNITSVNSLVLAGNDVLQDVSGLNALTNIDNSIYVANNTLLSDCCIFNDLLKSNTISGAITIENNAPGCNSEQDIETSCGPDICTGDFVFESQAEVDAFPGCEVIEGQLVIEGGDISDLTPLSSLKEIKKVLVIRNNSNLLTLDGLNNLTTIGGLAVVNNPLLQNLLPLSNVSSDDLSTLYFQKNKAIIDLKGLEGITGVQNLNIRENANLTTLEGLNNLAIGKLDFMISQNPSLENLNGLNSLHTAKEILGIFNNDVLTDISALSQLNSVFVLAISSNPSLTNLSGLENLSDVWTIAITGNDALENLDAFSSLTAITGDLTILGNSALSDCCGIQPLLNGGGIAGNILIENNPFACGSGFDIINNCGPSGVDLELSMSQANTAPAQWTTYPVTLTLSNTGNSPATGIVVHFPKPDGVVYAGGNEFTTSQGTFNPFGNQEWVVGKLKAGGMVTLTVNYFLLQSGVPVAYAQVSAVNEDDIDSSPNNGTPPSVNEDDEANSVDPAVSSACSGDIVLNSQAEVNAFGNCEIIDGNLMIVGDDIIDLTPLSSLKEVKGNLNIWNNGNLTNLEGLNNLFSVGGLTLRSNPLLENLLPLSNLSGDKLVQLVISKNKELLDLKGLEGVTGLEQLFIEGNTYLTTLEGLDNLVVAEGNMTIWRNSSLLNLNALANLQSVGAAFTIEQNYKLSDLSALANLGPCRDLNVLTNASLLDLSGLENISGLRDLTIAQNNGLKNLDAFSSLTSISGELTVRSNPELTDCCGIQPLLSSGNIGGTINIYFNPFACNNEQNILDNCTSTVCTEDVQLFSQAEVDAFQGCEIIEGILLINGADIIDLTPLSTVKEVTGNLFIYNNSSLTSLNGLNNLEKIGGLIISDNPLLESLTPLGNIKGDNLQSLDIHLNPSLVDLQGLEGIKCTNDITTVQNNTNLQSLKGLDNLRIVRDHFTVLHNPLLENLNGLENLDSVYFNLIIADSYSLNDVSALNKLRYAKYISIDYNPHLESIQGFETIFDLKSLKISNNSSLSNLDAFSGLISVNQISIINNPLLADCCIFSDLLNSNTISGPIDIQNNAPGCNSEQEIESYCGHVVCTGDVILSSQAEVDAFQGCEVIFGSLIIQGPGGSTSVSSDIHDLSPLLSLTEVYGTVISVNNDSLYDLNGLNNLTHLERLVIIFNENLNDIQALSNLEGEIKDLFVFDNNGLKNLDGLEGITGLSQSFELTNNPQLENIDGLSGLEYITGSALIKLNPSLNSISGLKNLTSVGINSNPFLSNHFVLTNCNALQSLDGLDNLTTAGLFIIGENAMLQDVSAVKSLVQVVGDFGVGYNPLLEDCCIFEDLLKSNAIGGSITINNNAPGCNSEQDIESSCGPVICTGDVILESQAEVDAFPGCEIIEGSLIIQGPGGATTISSDIHDLSPLLSLTEVHGRVISVKNDSLYDLNGLNALTSVGGGLAIVGCANLTSIQALSGISGEIGNISILENTSLVNLDGLEGINKVKRNLSVENNAALQNLNGLSNVDSVSTLGNFFPLYIFRNPSLVNIQGLQGLEHIGGPMVIVGCDTLENLNGLESLKTIGGFFVLAENYQLDDASALGNLLSVGGSFTMSGNPLLSDCCIFTDLINNNGISGSIDIQNNAPGCNSEQDIESSCGPVICIGDVFLSSQAEVDAFQGCEIIDGNLQIRPPLFSGLVTDIHSLLPLQSIKEVTGNIVIENNEQLLSLEGLNNITKARGLAIVNCDILDDIQALSSLSGELNYITILGNQMLTQIDGLEGITSVPTSITIDENEALQNVDGFSNLTSVGTISGVIHLGKNPNLTSLHGFGNLTQMAAEFQVVECVSLQNLDGLQNMQQIGGLVLVDNTQLMDVTALQGLTSVLNLFIIQRNPVLEDCCTFYDLLINNGIGGGIGIQDNPSFCSSEAEIVNHCQPNGIDLELSMTTSNLNPAIYTSSTVTLTLSNTGSETATGIKVHFPKPDGTVYTGGNEWTATQGIFNPFTNEEWTVGDLSAGSSVTLTVSYFLLTANALAPYAQVVAQNETDSDSSPGNGTPPTVNEDDEVTILLNGFTGNGGGISLKNHNERFRLLFDNIFPNPAKYLITMDIFSRLDQTVLLDFYDVTGRSIHRMEVQLEEGQNKVELDVSEWRSGTYNVIGRGEGLPAYGRFLKIWEE